MENKDKYAEALEKARENYKLFATEAEKLLLEDLFPELKENEDEKIRKNLIAHFERIPEHYSVGAFPRNTILAWLEKQKPYTSEELELNSLAYLEQLGYTCIPEKNPAELSDDDRMRKWIVAHLDSEDSDKLNDAFAWLEKQKPAEWSEEDENMLESIIRDFGHGYESSIGQARWLKSLSTRPKPNKILNVKDEWCWNVAWACVRDSESYNEEEKKHILNFLQRYGHTGN